MTKGLQSPKGPPLRRLSEEEIALWTSVAANVTPRPGATLPEHFAKPQPILEDRPAANIPAAHTTPRSAKVPVPPLAPLERKLKQKLSRGRMTADAAIDLHGLRQTEAHSALHHFLQRAQRDGARVVLVVTGKGGRQDDPFDMAGGNVGVLKRSVPLWLALPDFRAMVIGYEEAGQPHGGSGALYVRLRRRQRA